MDIDLDTGRFKTAPAPTLPPTETPATPPKPSTPITTPPATPKAANGTPPPPPLPPSGTPAAFPKPSTRTTTPPITPRAANGTPTTTPPITPKAANGTPPAPPLPPSGTPAASLKPSTRTTTPPITPRAANGSPTTTPPITPKAANGTPALSAPAPPWFMPASSLNVEGQETTLHQRKPPPQLTNTPASESTLGSRRSPPPPLLPLSPKAKEKLYKFLDKKATDILKLMVWAFSFCLAITELVHYQKKSTANVIFNELLVAVSGFAAFSHLWSLSSELFSGPARWILHFPASDAPYWTKTGKRPVFLISLAVAKILIALAYGAYNALH